MTISTYKNATDFRTARCTGTKVRPSIILTAGHCVDAIPEYNESIVDVSVYSVSCSKSFISGCSQSQVYGFVYYRHLARKNANFDMFFANLILIQLRAKYFGVGSQVRKNKIKFSRPIRFQKSQGCSNVVFFTKLNSLLCNLIA